MVWLEDPLTGDMPHRGIVEEEDEEQAVELAPQYAVAPAVQWAPGQAPVEGATLVSADADSCVGALESVCGHCTAAVPCQEGTQVFVSVAQCMSSQLCCLSNTHLLHTPPLQVFLSGQAACLLTGPLLRQAQVRGWPLGQGQD